jgi:hypothetical protein
MRLGRWDDHALALSEDDARRRPILSVRSVRVGDYGGCSLSTSRSSIVEVDAKIKEAEALRCVHLSPVTRHLRVSTASGGPACSHNTSIFYNVAHLHDSSHILFGLQTASRFSVEISVSLNESEFF